MSQKDNSKNDYLLELDDSLGEPLKLKLDKIKSLVAQGKELYAASFKKNISIIELQKKYSSLAPGEKSDEFLKLAGESPKTPGWQIPRWTPGKLAVSS